MKTNIYIFSGIDGGGYEDSLIDFLNKSIKRVCHDCEVFSCLFCNKSNYKEFDFEKAFNILDNFTDSNKKVIDKAVKNVFILHSFSYLTVLYFLNKYKYNFLDTELILIDPSNSVEIVDYFDSLKSKSKSEGIFLSDKTIEYMRLNNSNEIQKNTELKYYIIDSKNLNSDHNFTRIDHKENLSIEILKSLSKIS